MGREFLNCTALLPNFGNERENKPWLLSNKWDYYVPSFPMSQSKRALLATSFATSAISWACLSMYIDGPKGIWGLIGLMDLLVATRRCFPRMHEHIDLYKVLERGFFLLMLTMYVRDTYEKNVTAYY